MKKYLDAATLIFIEEHLYDDKTNSLLYTGIEGDEYRNRAKKMPYNDMIEYYEKYIELNDPWDRVDVITDISIKFQVPAKNAYKRLWDIEKIENYKNKSNEQNVNILNRFIKKLKKN